MSLSFEGVVLRTIKHVGGRGRGKWGNSTSQKKGETGKGFLKSPVRNEEILWGEMSRLVVYLETNTREGKKKKKRRTQKKGKKKLRREETFQKGFMRPEEGGS